MKLIGKAIIISMLALGMAACGIKGDVKPPAADTTASNFTTR